MKSILSASPSKRKPSPLEGTGNYRVQATEFTPHQISKREWWLWFSALCVTLLSGVAFLLSSFNRFFPRTEHFYEIRPEQARWATLCLLMVFNAWLVYRQWAFRSLRKKAEGQAVTPQTGPQFMAEAAGLDSITGLYTRAALEQHLGKEVARARRHNTALSLATVHVDEFAHLNSRYGKSAVDTAIKELARCLKKASRGSDIAARLSDDDFILLLPECGLSEVKQVLNRLGSIEVISSGEKIPVNYTTGWVDYHPGDLPDDLLKRAVNLLHLYDAAAQESFSATLVPH